MCSAQPEGDLHARVEEGKVMFWIELITIIIQEGSLDCKTAEKLAGRLNFVCLAVAGASGTARMSHIYAAAYRAAFSKHQWQWQ